MRINLQIKKSMAKKPADMENFEQKKNLFSIQSTAQATSLLRENRNYRSLSGSNITPLVSKANEFFSNMVKSNIMRFGFISFLLIISGKNFIVQLD